MKTAIPDNRQVGINNVTVIYSGTAVDIKNLTLLFEAQEQPASYEFFNFMIMNRDNKLIWVNKST